MKKTSLYIAIASIVILSIFLFAAKINPPAEKTMALQQLRSPVNKLCVCMPSPGSFCISASTGNIYPDYKVVCEGEPGYPYSSSLAAQ